MTGTTVLDRIAASVAQRLQERRERRPSSELLEKLKDSRTPHDFKAALLTDGPRFIAEIKFRSPSEGLLLSGATATEIAGGYLENGAAALSVLTESDHFGGSHEFLAQVRSAYPDARLLMKDFVFDPEQILEARVFGADAVLLIVALLGETKTAELIGVCRELGLTPLVEVHDADEIQAAIRAGADLIGVNNRDLKTLQISLDTSRILAPLAQSLGPLRDELVLVSESGLSRAEEIQSLHALGYRGFLIGSSFMKSGAPGAALGRLLEELE